MEETKEERILGTLKQRISQLEMEVKTTKEHLHSARDRNDDLEKQMELLRAEAHDVVGQWEKEATEVRKKLMSCEHQVAKLSTELREAITTKDALEEQVASLEKITCEYSDSASAQKEQIVSLEKSNASLTKQLTKTQAEFSEAMQQTKEYEELSSAMQKELLRAAEAEKNYIRDIESLRASLAHRTGEVEALRAKKDEISAQAEKLLTRISELKALNEQLCDDMEISQQHAKAHVLEVQNLKVQLSELGSRCTAAEMQATELSTEKGQLIDEVARLTKELADTEAVSQQQLEIISGLERDVQELQDTGVVQGKFLEEYQEQRELLENELAAATKAKEDAEAQFSAIKECYTNGLMEASDYKGRMETKCGELTAELDKVRADMSDALRISDQRSDAALGAIQQLTDSLRGSQIREVTLLERVSRQEAELCQRDEVLGGLRCFAQDLASRVCTLEVVAAKKANDLASSQQELLALSEKTETLKLRIAAADEELKEVRKSLATVENRATTATAATKELEDNNAALQRDNGWLKSQVEAMRTELGDLDELLNTNLNQMQEENEKHVSHIHALQTTVDELRANGCEAADKLSQYEQNFIAMENEFSAQAKTLEIAEADLRAANEEIDKLQNAVTHANGRLGEAEQRVSDLTRSNALLSTQNSTMKEQIRGQEEKQNLIAADKRREIENLRLKINQYVGKAEQYESCVSAEKRAREEAEHALAAAKETATKLRNALEEVKARCASDAVSLKQLIGENDELVRDRNDIVERFNRLHDAFRNVKRENNGKLAEELRKMLDFSTQQENELQQLRRENTTLKKSVSMFVTSAQPKAEAVFMERLNLTEGPLRHPKKRSVAKSSEPTVETK